MFNLERMINDLNESVSRITVSFREYFHEHLRNVVDLNHSDNFSRITRVTKHTDIEKLISGTGMYIILTNYKYDDNECEFVINDVKAIYRGHATRLKKRVESHLFNSKYQEHKSGTDYTNCIKIDGRKGIDINKHPYNSFSRVKWYVVQLHLPESQELLRIAAEKAFDDIFKRPLCSER